MSNWSAALAISLVLVQLNVSRISQLVGGASTANPGYLKGPAIVVSVSEASPPVESPGDRYVADLESSGCENYHYDLISSKNSKVSGPRRAHMFHLQITYYAWKMISLLVSALIPCRVMMLKFRLVAQPQER